MQWTRGKPFPQPVQTWRDNGWRNVDVGTKQTRPTELTSFTVLSWNIDFRRSFTNERMQGALAFLEQYLQQLQHPAFILFNEMLESDLVLIQAQPWVRTRYNLTDISSEFWEHSYGTCALIPRSIDIDHVFRVHYEDTAMGRDALFVDITVASKLLRICSTHLESLVATPPKRPSQLTCAARYMHEADASVLAGDLNAIEPFDQALHVDSKLSDAYLESGGREDDKAGHTWIMAPSAEMAKFGTSRMDKLYYHNVQLESFTMFGEDLQLADGDVAKEMCNIDGLAKPWVTDHLGIRGDFRLATNTDIVIE